MTPSEPETVIRIVRHGLTALNAQRRFRGRRGVPLDREGHAEAEQAAATLADRPITVVVASPLARTQETATPIANLMGLEIETDAYLLDIDHGSWESLTAAEAETEDPAGYATWREDPRSGKPLGGESMAQVEERIVRSVDRWGSLGGGTEDVLVSTRSPSGCSSRGCKASTDLTSGRSLATGSVTGLRGVPGNWPFRWVR